MYIPNFPEDSVLRRHFDSAVAIQRQSWLGMPPSDSTLRRHAMRPQIHPSYRASAGAASPAAVSVSTSPAKTTAEKKGFLARLFGLFSGKA